jgi:hypothetical protein
LTGVAAAPRRQACEEGDDQLDPVRHGDRDDIAGADAEAVEQRGRAGHPVGERRVVERAASSASADACGSAAARASGRRLAGTSRVSTTDMVVPRVRFVVRVKDEARQGRRRGPWRATTKFAGGL